LVALTSKQDHVVRDLTAASTTTSLPLSTPPFPTSPPTESPRARPQKQSPDAGVRHTRRMPGAAEGESQDSAFLRQALLEAGIGAASPCPSLPFQPSTTTAVPVVPVVPPQGATYHPATTTSSQQPPVPQTTHPL